VKISNIFFSFFSSLNQYFLLAQFAARVERMQVFKKKLTWDDDVAGKSISVGWLMISRRMRSQEK
jgi:hypothetical protein